MATEQPPIYNPPTDLDISVWRYMDLAKFVSLLSTRSLYFCRTDLLGDPYEGTMPHTVSSTVTDMMAEDQSEIDSRARLSAIREAYRQWAYVSCWHMNEDESAAMWSLYARTNEAVAIRSTYRKLRDGLPENVYTGTVEYIDYRTQQFPEYDLDFPLVHKRLSFQHEREVRAVIPEPPFDGDDDPAAKRAAILRENDEVGKAVPVSLDALVDRVYVAPTTPAWFSKSVASLVAQYGFAFDVYPSTLDEPPNF